MAILEDKNNIQIFIFGVDSLFVGVRQFSERQTKSGLSRRQCVKKGTRNTLLYKGKRHKKVRKLTGSRFRKISGNFFIH